MYISKTVEGEDTNQKAVQKLLECVKLVNVSLLVEERWGPEDTQALYRELETIAYALGMILEAVRQEQVST